jgi:CHAD domain-containing protein
MWLEAHASALGVRLEEGARHEVAETWYDTEDQRILRAGLCLSRKAEGHGAEAVLAPLASGEVPEAVRAALEGQGPEAFRDCGGLLGERVRALAGSRPLSARLELQRRTESLLLSVPDGKLGVLRLIETAIPVDDSGVPLMLCRVEVESAGAAGDRLQTLLRALESGCGLRAVTRSLYEAALEATGQASLDPVDLGPKAVETTWSVGELSYAVLRKHFGRWLKHEPGARLGEDIEELHDMRVAIRRMRAAFRLFRDHLTVRDQRLSDQLRWVAQATGDVRDLDVQLEQLQQWRGSLEEADRPALDVLEARLRLRHRQARRRMLRVLDSKRYASIVARVRTALARGPTRRSRAGRIPALVAGPDLVGDRFRRVVKLGRRLDGTSPPERFHRLRIRCKQLRYAIEFHSPLYGDDAQRMIRRMVRLQDLLGAHQDAEVAHERLRELVESEQDRLPPKTLFVVGRLAERYAMEAVRLRREFPDEFARVGRKDWKRLRQTMADGASSFAVKPAPRRISAQG